MSNIQVDNLIIEINNILRLDNDKPAQREKIEANNLSKGIWPVIAHLLLKNRLREAKRLSLVCYRMRAENTFPFNADPYTGLIELAFHKPSYKALNEFDKLAFNSVGYNWKSPYPQEQYTITFNNLILSREFKKIKGLLKSGSENSCRVFLDVLADIQPTDIPIDDFEYLITSIPTPVKNLNFRWSVELLASVFPSEHAPRYIASLLKLSPPISVVKRAIVKSTLTPYDSDHTESMATRLQAKLNGILDVLMRYRSVKRNIGHASHMLIDAFEEIATLNHVPVRLEALKRICEHYNEPWQELGKISLINSLAYAGGDGFSNQPGYSIEHLVNESNRLFSLGVEKPQPSSHYANNIMFAIGSYEDMPNPEVTLRFLTYLKDELGISPSELAITNILLSEVQAMSSDTNGSPKPSEVTPPCLLQSARIFDFSFNKSNLDELYLSYASRASIGAVKYLHNITKHDPSFLFQCFGGTMRLNECNFSTDIKTLSRLLLEATACASEYRRGLAYTLLSFLDKEDIIRASTSTKHRALLSQWQNNHQHCGSENATL